jgi:hypothetical protein
MVQSGLAMDSSDPVTCALQSGGCACDVTRDLPSLDSQTAYHVDGTKLVSADSEKSPFCVMGDTARISSSGADGSVSYTLKRH